MESKVIIRASVGQVSETAVNDAIKELGDGWYAVSASTTATNRPDRVDGKHSDLVFITTVVVQKN